MASPVFDDLVTPTVKQQQKAIKKERAIGLMAAEYEEAVSNLDSKIAAMKPNSPSSSSSNLTAELATSNIPLTPMAPRAESTPFPTLASTRNTKGSVSMGTMMDSRPVSSSEPVLLSSSPRPANPVSIAHGGRTISMTPLTGQSPVNRPASSTAPVPRKQPPPSGGLEGSLSPREDTKGETITNDAAGLRKAMKRGVWKTAIKVADSIIAANTSPLPTSAGAAERLLPHEVLQLQFCRVLSFIKLRLYKNASDELEALGNLDDPSYTYEHFPNIYPNKHGSFIPFSLRVYQAELPALAQNVSLSMDLLHNLLLLCRKEIEKLAPSRPEQPNTSNAGLNSRDLDRLFGLQLPPPSTRRFTDLSTEEIAIVCTPINDDVNVWRTRENRVLFSIATRLVQQKEFVVALVMLEEAVARYPSDPVLWSSVGRLHLQLGNINGAREAFEKVRSLVPDASRAAICNMNSGFLCLALDQYEQAIVHFNVVLEQDSSNFTAANNRAICLLYTCDLARAVASLEEIIRKDPVNNLNETLVFNLCTMYDLQSEFSIEKKKALMKLVARYGSDDFDPNVLRIPFERT